MYHVIADDKVRSPSSEANTMVPVDDVQEVHYYHTCKQCCKSLFNLLTSRIAVGLRQELGCMFPVFGLCHSLQLIQWEEVPCGC